MKIAYLIQYFGPPDNSFASARSFDFALEWAKSGHNVWVICSDAYLIEKQLPIIFEDVPITVSVIHQPYQNDFGLIARIQAFIFFAFKALNLLLMHPERWQFLYASSTPLTIALVGYLQKIITRKKWGLELRDLWPDFPLEVLGLTNTKIEKWARWIERRFYKSAEFVVCLSPIAKKKLLNENRIEKEKLFLIPNGTSEIKLEKSSRSKHYTGFYEGALGIANDIPWLLSFVDTFIRLEDTNRFVFAGFGKEEETIRSWIYRHPQKHKLTFLGTISRNKVYEVLATVDFTLVTFAAYDTLLTNSPNKLFDAFISEIPAITNKPGWIAELAEETGGFYTHSPKEAAKKINQLKTAKKTENKTRINKYSRSEYAKQVLTIIHNCG
jgi:glycosyltransferase involved in cell wall biosynthesis